MRAERGLWPEALVAALATLTVAWPITRLLQDVEWLGDALVVVLVVAVVGALLRSVVESWAWVVLLQLVAGVATVLVAYLAGTLWWGLPTWDTLEGAGNLLGEAGLILRSYAAPAPATTGVAFLVVSLLMLTAVAVDALAVTLRMPALAGLPLAVGFLVSVSNSGEAMSPYFFAAVASAWLVLVAMQSGRIVRSWASADRRESVGFGDVTRGSTGHRRQAQLLGSATVLGALLAASLLPHLPPTFFGEGLARNPEATDLSPGGQVSFVDTLDLAADLSNRSSEPVLVYRALTFPPQPLRITSTAEFDGRRWQPAEAGGAGGDAADGVIQPPSYTESFPDVPVIEAQIQVQRNLLDPPYVAVPSPLVGGDFTVPARYDAPTGAVRLGSRTETYSATYLLVGPTGGLAEIAGQTRSDPGDFAPELLEVPPAAEARVAALTDQVVGEATNTVEIGYLIQTHLRGAPYTYSLTLAPGADGPEPIGHFLETQQGYCVQFATAMVMMARHEGIPARLAVGFLPGQVQPDNTYQVVASDAHAWPELWIEGAGWTRFEPTPGVRATAPAYTQLNLAQEPEPALTGSLDAPTATAPEPTLEPQQTEDGTGLLDRLAPVLLRSLVVVAALALLMTLLSWAGRRHRQARLREARSARDRIEGQWELLTRSLEDYGLPPPPQRSPRGMRSHYAEATRLDRRSEEALHRVTATLERARYAPPAEDSDAERRMGRDVRSLVDAVDRQLPWNIRANARLLPLSGRRWLADLFRRH